MKSRFWDLCVSVDYRRFPLFWHRFWDDIFFGCVGRRVWKKKSKIAKIPKKKWAAFYLFLCFILVYFSGFGRCARVFTYKNFGLLFLFLVFFVMFLCFPHWYGSPFFQKIIFWCRLAHFGDLHTIWWSRKYDPFRNCSRSLCFWFWGPENLDIRFDVFVFSQSASRARSASQSVSPSVGQSVDQSVKL